MQVRRWHSQPDPIALQNAVVSHIADCAAAAIEARGTFHIVLAGGRTPRAIYSQLRTLATDWQAWSIFFGDERCLPAGDPERNDVMARNVWLDHVAIAEQRIHAIPAELGAEAGAQQYAETLADVGDFDLVLLGLGEDGHTASLFPHDDIALRATGPTVAVFNAPKPPPQRISMSAARIGRAQTVMFVVVGADKCEALSRWRRDEPIPAALINPPNGIDIYTGSALD
jgi:6-phosphogluconolactonase